MILTLAEIIDEVKTGKFRAISLDTSIIDAQQRSLEYGLLKRLQQFSGSSVQVVMTDIVIQETESHLRKDASEAQSSAKKAFKEVGQAWQTSVAQRDSAKALLFGTDTVETIAKKRVDGFIAATGAVIAKAKDHVEVGDLVDRYFAPLPPFADKETKKHEFPDALALLTLESWATENDTYILVVTRDGDWKTYCASSARLVAIDDLADALGCFQREAAIYKCRQLSQQLLVDDPFGIRKAVEGAIDNQGWKIEFIPEADSQFYYDVDDVEAEFQLVDFQYASDGRVFEPIEYGDDYLVAQLIVYASVDITGYFSFEKFDSIDRDYMSMGSGSATLTEDVEIEVLVTFGGQIPNQAEIDEIEVLAKREHISFGEIEPDWMNDPDNYDD